MNEWVVEELGALASRLSVAMSKLKAIHKIKGLLRQRILIQQAAEHVVQRKKHKHKPKLKFKTKRPRKRRRKTNIVAV